MSLRLKLLLLGLATLVLPWAGCNYAREMESALRQGEQNSLQVVSQTIAASLQGRTDLLYRAAPADERSPEEPSADETSHDDPSAGEAPQSNAPQSNASQSNASESQPPPDNPAQRGPYDLAPLALTAAPLVDGYSDDWPREPSRWVYCNKDSHHRFRLLSGVYERML
jgi:hypothetical protein